MKGWLLVAPEATADDGDLERWVRRGEARRLISGVLRTR